MQGLARRIPSVVLAGLAMTSVTVSGLGVPTAADSAFASGSTGAPAGNNGTVKVDGIPVDSGNDTDPHLGCDLTVSFYGYDAGTDHSSILLTPVAPTAGSTSYHATTGWTIAGRTGGNQLDRSVPITGSDLESAGFFDGLTAQAQQGYHVRLEVEVTGSQGSDDKYKVFWLDCSPPTTSSSSSTSTTSTTSTTTTTRPDSSPTTSPTTSTTDTTDATRVSTPVLRSGRSGSSGSPGADRSGSADAHSGAVPLARPSAPSLQTGILAFTGFNTLDALGAGLGLIATGGSVLILRRRRRSA